MRFLLAACCSMAAGLASAQQPGDLDPAFAADGILLLEEQGRVVDVALMPDGGSIAAARASDTTSVLVRLTEFGAVVPAFGDAGTLAVPMAVLHVLVQADGAILVVGNRPHACVHRYSAAGVLDLGFGAGGIVDLAVVQGAPAMKGRDAVLDADGRLLVVGDNAQSAFAMRLLADGTPDPAFGTAGGTIFFLGQYGQCFQNWNQCAAVRVLDNGHVLLHRKYMQRYNCSPGAPAGYMAVVEYSAAGVQLAMRSSLTFDNTFEKSPRWLAVAADGSVLVMAHYNEYFAIGTHFRAIDTGGVEIGGFPSYPEVSPGSTFGVARFDAEDRWLMPISGHPSYTFRVHRSLPASRDPDPAWGGDGIVTAFADTSGALTLQVQPDGKVLVGGFVTENGVEHFALVRYIGTDDPRARLDLRMCLGGAYDPAAGSMNAGLGATGLLPVQSPYAAPSFAVVNSPAAIVATQGAMAQAVVDWVWLELLSPDAPHTVVAARPALLLRNGTVTARDGVSPVDFGTGAGDYLLRVRHRNHLGITTAAPITLGAEPLMLDLTSPATATYGTDAQLEVDGVRMLWPGDVNGDGVVKYTGADNDRDPILEAIGGSTPTATTTGFLPFDVNLDGTVKYTGAANDRDPILQVVGGTVPTAVRVEQGP